MKLFSQRKGIRPLEKSIQKESIGDELTITLERFKSSCMDKWAMMN
jgi:hypothetical protein